MFDHNIYKTGIYIYIHSQICTQSARIWRRRLKLLVDFQIQSKLGEMYREDDTETRAVTTVLNEFEFFTIQ